jgi:dienelactone hydrolase
VSLADALSPVSPLEASGGSEEAQSRLDGSPAFPRPHPIYFGPSARPLFGQLHLPSGRWTAGRVLLCPPLGYEALFAHLTLSDLAAALAERASAVVMRFDYDGTGDSAGSDEEGERIPLALASIHHALDSLRRLSGAEGPLVVVGLRAGALLAAHALAQRSDVAALVLWAPCMSGKAFVREQRAFSFMTRANPAAPAGGPPRWGARGFEARGHVFTDATVAALETLRLDALPRPPAHRILLLRRDDIQAGEKLPNGWGAVHVEDRVAAGYASMMEPPWLWRHPTQAIDAVVDWVAGVMKATSRAPAALRLPPSDPAMMAPGVEEHPVWFGSGQRRFGVLTRRTGETASRAMLLVTSTFGYRVGLHRMNVGLARRLASSGIATLRIDIGGVGDSRPVPEMAPPAPYELKAVADVTDAIQYLRATGHSRVSLGGLCAGAFLAWSAALRDTQPVDLVLVNPVTFVPIHYDRETHERFLAPRVGFVEKLRAEHNLAGRLRLLAGRVVRASRVAMEMLSASLPTSLGTGMAAQLAELGRRGSRLALVYSSGDYGLFHYRRLTSFHHVWLSRTGVVSIRVIDGADHSFTPRWTTDRLNDAILVLLTGSM